MHSLIWKKESISDDWRKLILRPIPKEGNRTHCDNEGEIRLNISGKVFVLLLFTFPTKDSMVVIKLDLDRMRLC